MRLAETIALRSFRETDIGFLQLLRNDVQLQSSLLATARGSDLAKVKKWVASRADNDQRIFRVIEHVPSCTPIGYLQASEELGATEAYRFGICIGHPYQRHGYGTLALARLERYLADSRQISKLLLHVGADNQLAIACYEKLSYRRVGVMVRHVRVLGCWRDVLIMEKFLEVKVPAPS